MINQPTWSDVKLPKFPQLKKRLETDILIIGGGITGITAAYFLSKSRKKVTLIEKDTLCSGATVRTTALITRHLDTNLHKLIRMFGREQAKLIEDSHQNAIDTIEKIIKKEKITCEFTRCSNFFFAAKEKDFEDLKKEEKAALSLGLKTKLKKTQLPFRNFGYLEFPNQAKFHPLKYLSALAKIASKKISFFENTEALKIEGNGPYRIKTQSGEIFANKIIIATYAPFNKKLYFKKAFYRSYVLEAELPPKVLPEAIYEDTSNPYNYFRVDNKGKFDRIIFGGSDHRSDIPASPTKNFKALQDNLKKTFPNINFKITRKWTGPIVEPVDGIALIGTHKDENIFYATGFSGNGITYSTLAASLITNQLLGKRNSNFYKLSEIYSPERIPTARQLATKGIDYSEELFKGALKNSLKY